MQLPLWPVSFGVGVVVVINVSMSWMDGFHTSAAVCLLELGGVLGLVEGWYCRRPDLIPRVLIAGLMDTGHDVGSGEDWNCIGEQMMKMRNMLPRRQSRVVLPIIFVGGVDAQNAHHLHHYFTP